MALAAPAEIISRRLKPNQSATFSSPGVSGSGTGRGGGGFSSGLAMSGCRALRGAGKGVQSVPCVPCTSKTFGRGLGERCEVAVWCFLCLRFCFVFGECICLFVFPTDLQRGIFWLSMEGQ